MWTSMLLIRIAQIMDKFMVNVRNLYFYCEVTPFSLLIRLTLNLALKQLFIVVQ